MTPQKYPQNLHTPKKYSFFWKPQKILKFRILNPKVIARAYVCVKISEYPPGEYAPLGDHILSFKSSPYENRKKLLRVLNWEITKIKLHPIWQFFLNYNILMPRIWYGLQYNMSRGVRFSTMWYVRSANPQISLRIRAVWSEPLLIAWIFYEC